ncbi:MAG: colanic acid exporter [Pelotomaculum sp. PtaB.Bin104]|nr:MAG: colanic acid exporter [Pelotomaculum sp. PtaB.Bin104]
MKKKIDTFVAIYGGSLGQIGLTFYRRVVASDFTLKVAETFATKILIIVIGLVTTVIVARVLGPEGRGLYSVATAIGAVGVQFGNLGLQTSNTYYVAKNRELLPELVGNTLIISFILGGLVSLLVWIFFEVNPNLSPLQGRILVLALAWIPFGLAYMLLQNLLIGIQEVRSYNLIELISKILSVCFMVLSIFLKYVSVEIIFSAGLIALIISSIWVLWRLQKYLDCFPFSSLSLFKDNIKFGIKAYLAALFAFLLLRLDLIMVKYMLGAEQAGYYSIATTMADMVFMLPVVVGTILFPKLSAMPANKEKWEYTKRVTRLAGPMIVFLTFIAALLAKPIVRLLFGEAFLPSVPAFIWLLPGITFLGIQVIIVQFLNSIGFPKVTVVIWGIATLLNVFLNLWAIPIYGICGASLVSSFSYFAVFIFIMLIVKNSVTQKIFD